MAASNNDKIIDLIKAREAEGPFASIEFFPPRTSEGVKNLYARMDRMAVNTKPLFTDITWGAGGSTTDLSLEIALHMKEHNHIANLHMTCTNMDPSKIEHALKAAHAGGVRNIVALRGDPPSGEDDWTATDGGFTCALDLVKYIRQEWKEEFGISVAGYPEGHPTAIDEVEDPSTLTDSEKLRSSVRDGKTYCCRDESYAKELAYLKEKIDAGGDFIITQMFFDTEVYGAFVADCRAIGIECPVLPGIMCINGYGGFRKMTGFCKTRVPAWLDEKMESIKDDTAAVKQFGTEFGVSMCQRLLELGAPGLHFYTLNLEKCVYGITDGLGWTQSLTTSSSTLDSDAQSMAAVGSAWARVGDTVKSIYGTGTVQSLNKDGSAAIRIENWLLAGGQHPTAYLQKSAYQKVFG